MTLVPDQQMFSSRVSFEPGPHDWNAFESLDALATHTQKHGHYGGVRLLRSLCCKFHAWCAERGVPLHGRGFCLKYKTNIPKQTGLSGSSSIIVAGLKCLMRYYGVDIPMEDRPALVLSCETNLGINAGLQDRVIQCYEGVVSMDFTDDPPFAPRVAASTPDSPNTVCPRSTSCTTKTPATAARPTPR